MFTRRFWRDAGEAFLIAAAAVAFVDGEQLVQVGSLEQLGVVGVAVLRASVIAGLRAVAPRIIALRDSSGQGEA